MTLLEGFMRSHTLVLLTSVDNLNGAISQDRREMMFKWYFIQHLNIAQKWVLNGKNNKVVHAAFQLLVKPGAYSISRETEVVEWSTKETGAITLNSLLLKID
ncbi:hypothetical protein NQ317_003251 [Molorchus minor]|uniref:Uncharacterized protein n=1 Tax=Molorchus minor TaxID=1323400 RepID=A0ABQ9J668_9CUCU|nr:hypothetical protein NQ317_003251 [Molorchus minor]